MSTGQPTACKLSVETNDEAAEIFIIDSQFHRIAAASGKTAEFTLPGGLYAVKVRTGSKSQEKSIALFEDAIVRFDPLPFSTAAPLEGTAKTHEYHIGNAMNHSQKIHAQIGTGSQLYVFVRNWTSKTSPSGTETLQRTPAAGLTLRNQQGEMLLDFEASSDQDLSGDPWAACNVELDPGIYRLRLETAEGNVLEQSIVASSGWQTQVFLLLRNYGLKEKDFRADVAGSSVFMLRIGEGFRSQTTSSDDPVEANIRLADLARQALMNDRSRLAENVIRQTLDEKAGNPMLGIYGANLLLRTKNYDQQLLITVVNNLRALLPEAHPDVEALALKAGMETSYTVDMPPMLRSSWTYLLEASVKQPALIPESSLAVQVTGSLWSEGLWLVWGKSEGQADSDKVLLEQLKNITQAKAAYTGMADAAPVQEEQVKSPIPPELENVVMQMPLEQKTSQPVPAAQMSDAQIQRLVQTLGVPRSKLESMLKSLHP